MESIQIKGGNLMEFVERATGSAPSKEEHANLISSLRKEAIEVENKLKKTRKIQKKINTEVLSLTGRLKNIDDQIAKSQKIVQSFLGGRKRKTQKRSEFQNKEFQKRSRGKK
jgi:capsule polysaccharide export protein KpsE/RkpR